MKRAGLLVGRNTVAGYWTEHSIAGHPAYAFDPTSPSPHGSTVLYLHDEAAERLQDHVAFTQLLDENGLRCLAPVTGRSWWSNRISPEFDAQTTAERYVFDRVLPWLAEHWNDRTPAVALLGVGMGGQGALRLAYKHPNVFPVVAAIAPMVDFQWRMEEGEPALNHMYRDEEEARQDTATLHIHPLNWPRHQWFCCDPADYRWHESVDRLRMKLYSLGVPYECDLETTGGGHDWPYYETMATPAMNFIVERLERERLRA
jgi:S-formylglutathione hydrolase FrmB